jgi:hypothetical protein
MNEEQIKLLRLAIQREVEYASIDGSEMCINDGIKKWCKENSYNLGELYKLKRGDKKTNRYRDIIKFEMM